MSLNKVFREIGRINTERSAFNLSHKNITTANMGILYPVLNLFAMPGDKFTINISSLLRALPLVYPGYVEMNVQFDTFFVPSRLLWDDFEDFISGGEDGDFIKPMPKINLSTYNTNDLKRIFSSDNVYSRLGLLPTYLDNTGSKTFQGYQKIPSEYLGSSLPFRAYYFIWNEYYRDQNLQDKVDFSSLNHYTSQTIGDHFYGFKRVSWLKDYFTSALPFQQRGTSPSIPFEALIDTSDLVLDTALGTVKSSSLNNLKSQYNINQFGESGYFRVHRDPAKDVYNVDIPAVDNLPFFVAGSSDQSSEFKAFSDSSTANFLSKLKVNVSDSFNIAELRSAFQVQKWLERNARAGVRYTEFLQAHYNVSPSDARLDRPEYIGGAKFPLVISDVLQTSSSTQNEPLGSYAGRGISAGFEDMTDYFVEEFGYILTLMHIRPKTGYIQGINRQFMYNDRFEYPFPEFMHLSEQGIYNSEIYNDTETVGEPGAIFGYQGIYDELRVHPNVYSGLMARKDYQSWHLARIFEQQPNLNSAFISCNPRSDIFSVTDSNLTAQFFGEINFDIKAVRPMPIIGEPGLIDHF